MTTNNTDYIGEHLLESLGANLCETSGQYSLYLQIAASIPIPTHTQMIYLKAYCNGFLLSPTLIAPLLTVPLAALPTALLATPSCL